MAKGSKEAEPAPSLAATNALGQAVGAQLDADMQQGSQKWADLKIAAAVVAAEKSRGN